MISAIVVNGDRFILVDALAAQLKIAFEIDGPTHAHQKKYDLRGDRWLMARHGIRTIRFTNQDIYRRSPWVREQIIAVAS